MTIKVFESVGIIDRTLIKNEVLSALDEKGEIKKSVLLSNTMKLLGLTTDERELFKKYYRQLQCKTQHRIEKQKGAGWQEWLTIFADEIEILLYEIKEELLLKQIEEQSVEQVVESNDDFTLELEDDVVNLTINEPVEVIEPVVEVLPKEEDELLPTSITMMEEGRKNLEARFDFIKFDKKKGKLEIDYDGCRNYLLNNKVRNYANGLRVYKDGYYTQVKMKQLNELFLDTTYINHNHQKQIEESILADVRFDIEPEKTCDYICFKNGILNLKTWEIEPHTPKRYFILQIPHNYDPNAEQPQPNEYDLMFKNTILKSGQNAFDLLMEMFGATFAGIGDKSFYVLHGKKNCGKSLASKLMMNLLTTSDGIPLYSTHKCEILESQKSQTKDNLLDVYLNISEEWSGVFNNQDIIKDLSGGNSVMSFDPKYKPIRQGVVKCKFWFITNHYYQVYSTQETEALEDRMKVIMFKYTVPSEEQIKDMDKLFNYDYWIYEAMEGFKRLKKNGFYTKQADISEFKRDSFTNWINNYVKVENTTDYGESFKNLYQSYIKSLNLYDGEKADLTQRQFKNRLLNSYGNDVIGVRNGVRYSRHVKFKEGIEGEGLHGFLILNPDDTK